MASDRRWTGGTANRDWSAGTAVTTEVPAERLTEGVKAYLANCRRYRHILSVKYHPSEDSAVSTVFHRTKAGEAFIRAEFSRMSAIVREVVTGG